MSASAPTATALDALPGAPLGDLHAQAALVALAVLGLEREERDAGTGGALVRALLEHPGADAALLLAQADAGANALRTERSPCAPSRLFARAGSCPPSPSSSRARCRSRRTAWCGRCSRPARPTTRDGRPRPRRTASLRGQATSGTWRRLLAMAVSDPDELATCVATSIGPAVEHDARLRTELVATFRAYLDHGANMNATAAAIYAHRHTVAARLERLRALTRLDPTRHDDRERLGVGLKARAVLTAAREVGRALGEPGHAPISY
jgi:hypothetical protein